MKKPTLKRMALELLQHITAIGIMIAVAVILFNSYIGVTSMRESRTYWLAPLETEPDFEDTDVYKSIRNTAVSDVLQFAVIRKQLETEGRLDLSKHINITKYSGRTQDGYNCDTTAVYELDDLIKWGKSGVEYSTRALSISDFVNYFGNALSPDNFDVDAAGQLYFSGFNDSSFSASVGKTAYLSQNVDTHSHSEEMALKVNEAMSEYTDEQLEDMAFSYIMSENTADINVNREDDGSLTVYFNMISCRYDTVDGERQLTEYAGNWIDYMMLQQNLADTIENVGEGYQLYQSASQIYAGGATNFIYTIRMADENGILHTYTNNPDVEKLSDDEMTEAFSEYRRYFIYYYDNLEFTGITDLAEADVYVLMKETGYDFPENTRIWMAVDTTYPVEHDAFADAYTVFERIVPNIVKLMLVIALLAFIWICIFGSLTESAGVMYDENGERVYYSSGIDKIWTEIMLIAVAALIYAGYRGAGILMSVAETVYNSHSEMLGMNMTKIYEYGTFGVFGAAFSISVDMLWFSFLRRVRCGIVWTGSFIYWLFCSFRRAVHFILSHRNTAISTLLPYNALILVNLVSGFAIYKCLADSNFTKAIICIVGIICIDGIVGVKIFRSNAEKIDIVDGIMRIRDGEVDYKLDTASLSGTNRDMADAVNNIGEGIRKAVHTSMKDEQMKSDLITNVSHDIKTPLTSIINYVDLLKRLKIEDEPAKNYIDILDEKSQRLKQLTEDLLEASKISSGNITLNMEKLNLTELINQTIGEFSEKLEERGLSVVFDDNNAEAYVNADSRRMWRIADNLFNNICKYALENTRVYVDISVNEESRVELSIKNISMNRMNIKGDELTERFIRGDSSRTTEGSGLGLFIAKSLTEVQNGTFEIRLDGDLFKVILSFPEYREAVSDTE